MTDPILIFTDLDRTLIPNGHAPESSLARPLLRELVNREDVYLAYVSGRDRRLLLDAIDEWDLPVPDFAIGDVGTTIYTIDNDDWQELQAWQENIAQDWLGFSHNDIAQNLTAIKGLTLQEPEKQNNFKLSYYTRDDISLPDILAKISQQLKDNPIQYNTIWSIDEVKQIGLLDILPARANKLHAIRFLMDTFKFTPQNSVFSGDSGNDLEVLCSDIQATVVNNASNEIKEQAKSMAKERGNSDQLYIARGEYLGMNGNYAAGILEGIAHYIPRTQIWLEDIAKSRL